MSKKRRRSNFSDKTGDDAGRRKSAASSYGYLNLPKGLKVYNPKPGSKNNYLDFMPYEVKEERHPDRNDERDIATVGSLWYKRPFKTHRNIGVDEDTVICLKSFGKKCPICEHKDKLAKDGEDWESIKHLNPSNRNLYVVIPIDSRDYEGTLYLWDISQYLFQDLLDDELDEEDNRSFPDLETGKTLKIRFDASTIGKGKPFAEASRIDFEDREAYDEDILNDIPSLETLLNVLSYKELEAKFFDLDEEEEAKESFTETKEEEEEVRKPIRRRKKHTEPKPEPEPENKEKEDDKCPHGYKFGTKDCEQHEECDSCDVWNECIDEKEANEKK